MTTTSVRLPSAIPDWDALCRQAEALATTSSDPLAVSFARKMAEALAVYRTAEVKTDANGRRGRWCWLHTGGRFYPIDPRAEEVRLDDIVWALSHQNRYGGHTIRPYSVLTHSILVRDIARWLARGGAGGTVDPSPEELLRLDRQSLLHDSPETYVDDVRNPLKPYLGGYDAIERGVALVIGDRFGMGDQLAELDPIVRHADQLAVAVEARELCGDPRDWGIPEAPEGFQVVRESPMGARIRFRDCIIEAFPALADACAMEDFEHVGPTPAEVAREELLAAFPR